MKREKFAAFIITYERPHELVHHIIRLQEQSFPPERILIVDNSHSSTTEVAIKNKFSESKQISYVRMGYNSGPAGAAKRGLLELVAAGYEWIYWGDDDNPPRDSRVFESYFRCIAELAGSGIQLGIFGGKGGRLNPYTGRIRSLSNDEIRRELYPQVDVVPGGHDLLVHSEVIRQGILPTEKLFFGFEELDFCLMVKKASFEIRIDALSWLRAREGAGNTGADFRWRSTSFGSQEKLGREYYSTRNLLEIFFKNHLFMAFSYWFLKAIGKSLAGFTRGWSYGKKMAAVQFTAVGDFIRREFSSRRKLY